MLHQRAECAVLAGVETSRAFFAPCFDGEGGERLWVAHVDSQARCMRLASYHPANRPSHDSVCDILREATRLGSAGVILAHREDSDSGRTAARNARAARELASRAAAIDVTVVDHLIFAGANCTSMRRIGLL